MKFKELTWPQVALLAIVVPSVCGLVYGLVKAGENIGGLAAAVGTVLAALGWQASRTKAQIEEVRTDVGVVKELANGNLSRADAARDAAQQEAIRQLEKVHERHLAAVLAQFQQTLQLAVQSPPGTYVPPVPAAEPARVDAGNTGH
jgi:hypothetical protein